MTQTIAVQRGFTDIAGNATSATSTITAVSSLSSAFVFITGTANTSAGDAAGSTTTKNQDVFSARVSLTATTTVTVEKWSATGETDSYRVYWELWEYVGVAGGPDEFIVRLQFAALMNNTVASTTVSLASAGISSLADCVIFPGGVANNSPSRTWQDVASTYELTAGTPVVTVTRAGSTGRTYANGVVVEFTGANWSVQNNISISITSSGAKIEATVTDVSDWSTAIIVGTMRTNTGELAISEFSCVLFPKAGDTTKIIAQVNASATPSLSFPYTVVCAVLKNTRWSVEHLDSIDGGEAALSTGSASPNVDTYTISTLGSLAYAGVFAYATCAGTGSLYPRPCRGYRLASTTTMEYIAGRHGGAGNMSAQIITMPATVEVELDASGTIAVTGIAELTERVSMVSAGAVAVTGAAELTELVSMIVSGTIAIDGATDATLRIAFDAAGQITVDGASDLTVRTSLEASGTVSLDSAAELSARISLITPGTLSLFGVAVLDELVTLAGSGTIQLTGSANLEFVVTPGCFAMLIDRLRVKFNADVVTPNGLSVQYDNLPLIDNGSDIWAEQSVEFDRVATGEIYGAATRLVKSGRLIARFHAPVETGEDSILDLATQTAAAFTRVSENGVFYGAPFRVRSFEHEGYWVAEVRCPFTFRPLLDRATFLTGIGSTKTFEGVADTIRAQFDERVAVPLSLATAYENWPANALGQSIAVGVFILPGAATLVDSQTMDSTNLMVVQLLAPLGEGTAGMWSVVDSISDAFRAGSIAGVAFGSPTPNVVGERDGKYQLNLNIPFYADLPA